MLANGDEEEYLWDGNSLVYINPSLSEYLLTGFTAYYGLGIFESNQNGTKYRYQRNAHGDTTALLNQSGDIVRCYTYEDAFGTSTYSADDTNPFRYAGQYYDCESQSYYLRARYYLPRYGRFTAEDPARDGLNWYTYCADNPVRYYDPSGTIREPIIVDGELQLDPDAYEFGSDSDTYKILNDLGNRWREANEREQTRLHELAEQIREYARCGTPCMYGESKITEALMDNTSIALAYEELYSIFGPLSHMPNPYIWFVSQTCTVWDYKWNSNWQVPYDNFAGMDMNAKQKDGGYPKNWVAWIYYEGQLMGADKVGNLNLGYVGKMMGYDGWLLQNQHTTGGGDGYWIYMGINKAKGQR